MSISKKSLELLNLVTLFLIWLFHMVFNYFWLKIDTAPLIYDSHKHFLISLRIFELYKSFSPNFLSKAILLTQYHPPFVYLITAPFYFIFGISQDVGVMINSAIFLAILILSIYGLAKYLFNSKVALLAVFLATMYPIMSNQLRVYMLDIPLASMVALNIYLLFLTNNFRRTKFIILWSFSLGLGLLIKLTFLFFIIGPMLIYALHSFVLKKSNISIKRPIFPALAILLILSIPFIYFVMKYENIHTKYISDIYWYWEYLLNNYFSAFFIYIFLLINNLSFFFTLIFIATFYFYLYAKFDGINKILLSCAALFPLIMLPLLRSPLTPEAEWVNSRYLIPSLPFIAIISAIGITRITNRHIKKIIISLIIFFGILQFFAISFSINLIPQEIKLPITIQDKSIGLNLKVNLFSQNIPNPSSHGSHPVNENWEKPVSELIESIYKINKIKETIIITFLYDIPEVWGLLQYKTYTDKLPFKIYCDSIDIYGWHPIPLEKLILDVDYILTEDNPSFFKYSTEAYEKKALDFFREHINKFKLIKKIELPDNSNLLIYKKIPQFK